MTHLVPTVVDPEFAAAEFFDARDLAQVMYEMVRRVRVGGALVTRAAATFGFSRPSYYQAAAALAARFGVRMHPRSIERALARRPSRKSAG